MTMTAEHEQPLCPPTISNDATIFFYKGSDGASSEIAQALLDCATDSSNKIHTGQPEDSTPLANSSSMDFNLIREEDAEILEQGVEKRSGFDLADFDDDGYRLEASASDSSLTEFEDEVAAGEDVGDHNFTLGKIIDESRNGLAPFYSAPPLACRLNTALGRVTSDTPSHEDTGIISMHPAVVEGSTCHAPHDPATNDSWPLRSSSVDLAQLESLPENDNYVTGSPSSDIPSNPQETDIGHEALAQRKNHRRHESFDRRMHESAQFAEAVGEETNSLLLKKIFEEDSSSDFDDVEIDEGGKLLIEDEAGGALVEGTKASQNIAMSIKNIAVEQFAGTPSHENVQPRCVSTDLAQMSFNEEERLNSPTMQQQGQLPQLSTALELANRGGSSTTQAPSASTSLHPPCYVNWKFTCSNSFGLTSDKENTCQRNGVPTTSSQDFHFGYRGIPANPPVITKRGMARGNYAQLHRKAWLEVSDKHHRYGKNLRLYYKHWETLGHPFRMFFDWLDSKGEAMGSPLPNLSEIPRSVLDADTVLYITNPEISARYALGIVADPNDGSGIIVDWNGKPIHTRKEGWIFVLRDHLLYGSPKVTAPSSSTVGRLNDTSKAEVFHSKNRHRFHHSSFFGGKAVASAGIFITNEQGRITRLYPHSGHYRPGEAHMQRTLFFFQQLGVELSTFTVDMQQIFKVSRKNVPGTAAGEKLKGKKEKDKTNNATIEGEKYSLVNSQGLSKHSLSTLNTKKSRKTDCLHLMCGLEVACFLTRKALMIKKGVFHQIHNIRRIPKESRGSASFILNFVNV